MKARDVGRSRAKGDEIPSISRALGRGGSRVPSRVFTSLSLSLSLSLLFALPPLPRLPLLLPLPSLLSLPPSPPSVVIAHLPSGKSSKITMILAGGRQRNENCGENDGADDARDHANDETAHETEKNEERLGGGGNACRFLDSVDAPFGTVSSEESSRATIADYSRLTSVWKTVIDHDGEAEAPREDGSCVRTSPGVSANGRTIPKSPGSRSRTRAAADEIVGAIEGDELREGLLAPPLGEFFSLWNRASRSDQRGIL